MPEHLTWEKDMHGIVHIVHDKEDNIKGRRNLF